MSFLDDLVHISLVDGVLFDQLDVLEARSQFPVVDCTLTLNVALILIFSSLLTGSAHSISTKDGEHVSICLKNLRHFFHLILGANAISFGSKFQDKIDSFGFFHN